MCENCGQPGIKLWPPLPKDEIPKFTEIFSGNYIDLCKCESCGCYWCSSPYEPNLSFNYFVIWELSELGFRKIHAFDEGKPLSNWHISMIKALWKSLDDKGLASVETHRKRTYYSHNPIDGLYSGEMPKLNQLI